MGQLTGTKIVIETLTELTAEIETTEAIVIQEEHQIVGTIIIIIILEMEVTGTGIDTVNMTAVDPVLLAVGKDAKGHPEVHISEIL